MLSLRQSIKSLDEAEVAQQAAAKAFAEALATSAEHVVEVDREDAREFREQVLQLVGRVSSSTAMEDLAAARRSYGSELRDYSEKARVQVGRLREELGAAATAMQTFASGVSNSTGEHDTVLRHEFQQLERAADSEDVRAVRAAVHDTVRSVTESYAGLKQAQALVVAQLRDEIRVLHSELERGKTKTAPPEGISPKANLDNSIEQLMRQDRSFAVLLVGVADARELYRRYPRKRVEAAVADMLDGLTALVRAQDPKAILTQFNRDTFAAVLPSGTTFAEWPERLAANHVFQLDGLPRTLRMAPVIQVVARDTGESPSAYFERLRRVAETLTNDPFIL